MASVKLYKQNEVTFAPYGEGMGEASISRLVGPGDSVTMGAYLARFNGRSVEWSVRYDELIVCIQGVFELTVSDVIHRLDPGDVLWVPNGTVLKYGGRECLVFMAIAPVDWRSKHL